MTAVATATFAAADWNTHIRDNLNAAAIGLATGGVGRHFAATGVGAVAERTTNTVTIATSQTRASTTYGDLATVGPAATVTSGVRAMIVLGAFMSNSTAGNGGRVAVATSGAHTSSASDTNSWGAESGLANDGFKGSYLTVYNPITAGSTTWTLKYRTVVGGTATFTDRNISVVPF